MSDARLLAILDFWHKLEFFIPFDLESRAQADVRRKSLWRVYNDMSPVRYDKPPEGMRVSGYTVFLGVFDKADIRNLLDGLRPIPEGDAFEDEMRGDLKGRTCMASLDLCPEGRPLFQSFKVSTLPWAIGRVRSDGLGALSSAAFQAALLKLQDLLTNLAACRSDFAGDDPAGDLSTSLMPREIDELADLLAQWSGFRPAGHHPAALLEVRFGKTPPQRKTAGATDSAMEEKDEEDSEDTQDIGILNSFFIPDLERAMASVSAGETPAALRQYLTPLPPQDRCNLFSAQGRGNHRGHAGTGPDEPGTLVCRSPACHEPDAAVRHQRRDHPAGR